MVEIDLDSVEDVVCYDKSLRALMPSLKGAFQQWELSVTLPGMGSVRKRVLADILRTLATDYMDVLRDHLGDDVRVQGLDYAIVRNVEVALDRAEDVGEAARGMLGFAVSRDADRMYVSFWR